MEGRSKKDAPQSPDVSSRSTDTRIAMRAMLQRLILKDERSKAPDEEECDKFPEPHKYETLPPRSIRLLKIWPYLVSKYEPLVVSLHVVHLDDEIPFDALSYTWGPPTWISKKLASTEVFTQVPRCYPVFTGSGIVRITRNLRDALIHLRGWQVSSKDKELFRSIIDTALSPHIWIDEISINQDDLEERSQQVAIMGELYSRANLVVCWLGEQETKTRLGFDMLRQVEQVMDQASSMGQRVMDASFYDEGFWRRVGHEPFSTEQWAALTELITRDWFTRTWVIQELALAKKPAACLCGSSVLPMNWVLKIVGFLWASGWGHAISMLLEPLYSKDHIDFITKILISHPFEWIRNIQERTNKSQGYSFALLQAYTFPTSSCFDPRDKIYATMAMATEFTSHGETILEVDYEESASHTYIRASRRCLEISGSLDLLSVTAHLDRTSYIEELRHLPSWCPNYSSNDPLSGRPQAIDLQPDPMRSPNTFAASGGSMYLPNKALPQSPFLHVKGFRCGSIAEVAASRMTIEIEDLSHTLDLLLSFCEAPQGHRLGDMFWRTLVHNMYGPTPGDQLCPATEETAHTFLRLFSVALVNFFGKISQTNQIQKDQYVGLASKMNEILQLHPDTSSIFPDFTRYLSTDPEQVIDSTAFDGLYDDFTSEAVHSTKPLYWNITAKGRSRRLFRTSGQRLGMGLQTMRAGDEVWLVAGGRVPYVLRPLENGNYEFHGEAYVHGIMMGEAWPEDEGELVDVVLE